MGNDVLTKISKDGLRYKSKIGGSPYMKSANARSLSCTKCGRHQLRQEGSFKRILNSNMFYCSDCKPKRWFIHSTST